MLRHSRRRESAPLLRFYTREGCCLCAGAMAELRPHVRRGELRLEVIDIGGDAELEARYGRSIPVLEFEGRAVAKGRFRAAEALARLARRRAR